MFFAHTKTKLKKAILPYLYVALKGPFIEIELITLIAFRNTVVVTSRILSVSPYS